MTTLKNIALFILTISFISCAGDNPITLLPMDKYLYKVEQIDNKLITIGTEGRIYTSIDGNAWNKKESKVNATLLDVFPYNSELAYITGEKGLFLKSNDGGNNWSFNQIPSNQSFYSVFFLDNNKGWVSGNSGKLFITNDGGNTWKDTSFIDEGFLNEVYFENNGFGFISGSKDASFSESLLYITNDFGQNWEEIDLSSFEMKGITNVKYFSNGFYLISEDKVLYTTKSNKFKDFEIVIDDNIYESTEMKTENNFKITSIFIENNETLISGIQGHNMGMIYNKGEKTFVKTNIHILDMIKFNSNELYFGGYGYKIYKKSGSITEILDLEK